MRFYIDCPYNEKEEAKALGAKWDKDVKRWYYRAEERDPRFDRWQIADSPTADATATPEPTPDAEIITPVPPNIDDSRIHSTHVPRHANPTTKTSIYKNTRANVYNDDTIKSLSNYIRIRQKMIDHFHSFANSLENTLNAGSSVKSVSKDIEVLKKLDLFIKSNKSSLNIVFDENTDETSVDTMTNAIDRIKENTEIVVKFNNALLSNLRFIKKVKEDSNVYLIASREFKDKLDDDTNKLPLVYISRHSETCLQESETGEFYSTEEQDREMFLQTPLGTVIEHSYHTIYNEYENDSICYGNDTFKINIKEIQEILA